MRAVEDAASDWRGHESEKTLPAVALINSYAKEHPSLPIGLPPLVLDQWAAANKNLYDKLIIDNPKSFLKDLQVIFNFVSKQGHEFSLAALTLLIEIAQRVRTQTIKALSKSPIDTGTDISNLFILSEKLLDKSSASRRNKCKQRLSSLDLKGTNEIPGQILLDIAWQCIPPRYTNFPTPSSTCPATDSYQGVLEVLRKDMSIHNTVEEIWKLIRSNIQPRNDEYAKHALCFIMSVFKTYLSGNSPTVASGMFVEGARNKSIGTVHKIFVTATPNTTGENVIHCPQGFSDSTNSQVRMAVNAALMTYMRDKDTYEVTVSIDDLPGGIAPGINVEGESLGLTVAVALISKLSNQTIEQDTAITGRLSIDGDTVYVGNVGGVDIKVVGAEARGIQRVVVPLDNVDEANRIAQQCNVVGVDTLAALINRIWVFEAHTETLLCKSTGQQAPTPIARNMSLLDFFKEQHYRPQDVALLKKDGTADRTKSLPVSELLFNRELPSQIALFGESGLGKTSALFYLMFQATSAGQAKYQSPSIVPWYVRMRDYKENSDGIGSICTTLVSACSNKINFDGKDIRRTLEDPNFPPFLILLDALNELSAIEQIKVAKAVKEFCEWIEELNKNRDGQKHRVILTYRKEPHATSLVTESLMLEIGAQYELQRLPPKDVSDYLKHLPDYLKHIRDPADLLKLFSPEVQDLFTIPLFLFLATELAGLPPKVLKQIKNKALLYKEVTQQWLRREWWDEKTASFLAGTEFNPLTDESLECCVDFHAKALSEIAYHMTEMGLTELPQEEIIKIVHSFVKKDLSKRRPKDFKKDGPWQWLREYVKVLDIPNWAKEEGDGFDDFAKQMTRSLLRSTVLQGM